MEKTLLNLLLKQGGQRYVSWHEEDGMIRVNVSEPNAPDKPTFSFKLTLD